MSNRSGIQGFSTEQGQQSYVIFSIDDPSPMRINQFINYLNSRRAPYKVLAGFWAGTHEQSFLLNDQDYYRVVAHSEWIAKQDCVLLLGPSNSSNRRPASAMYFGTGIKHRPMKSLGWLRSVSKATALKADAWSYDVLADEWFITGPDAHGMA